MGWVRIQEKHLGEMREVQEYFLEVQDTKEDREENYVHCGTRGLDRRSLGWPGMISGLQSVELRLMSISRQELLKNNKNIT